MTVEITVYNTLSRKKELLKPLNPPYLGMYVCGPTVYGDAHLGHARPAITFDLVFRYLTHAGYKVRYVRNITDVGHLENDADAGEDKIAKKARLEQLEPMEIVQYYTDRYHHNMEQLNVKPPSIEPRASGHIIEQIKMIREIIDNGYAYVVNGSVYFDVTKYSKSNNYGKLSGRVLDDLLANTRVLEGQEEKRSPLDFALWKKAAPEHIMRWPSPWGEGFPGWHIECSVMSSKYLGEVFDIHGGGMDLVFPHHECEIAQSKAATQKEAVRYWLHNNMVTINGQKMGKSLGNFITLNEFFSGESKLLEKAYSPMTIRFFILQAHYRSTLDFSNFALQSAEKGLKRLWSSFHALNNLPVSGKSSVNIREIRDKCYEAMNDDFNSPMVIAGLFEAAKIIHLVSEKKEEIDEENLALLKKTVDEFMHEILGLRDEGIQNTSAVINELMNVILSLRKEAKEKKNYAVSDKIREELSRLKIAVKDGKEGATWEFLE